MINIKKAKDYVPRALIPLTLDFHLRSQNCKKVLKHVYRSSIPKQTLI